MEYIRVHQSVYHVLTIPFIDGLFWGDTSTGTDAPREHALPGRVAPSETSTSTTGPRTTGVLKRPATKKPAAKCDDDEDDVFGSDHECEPLGGHDSDDDDEGEGEGPSGHGIPTDLRTPGGSAMKKPAKHTAAKKKPAAKRAKKHEDRFSGLFYCLCAWSMYENFLPFVSSMYGSGSLFIFPCCWQTCLHKLMILTMVKIATMMVVVMMIIMTMTVMIYHDNDGDDDDVDDDDSLFVERVWCWFEHGSFFQFCCFWWGCCPQWPHGWSRRGHPWLLRSRVSWADS